MSEAHKDKHRGPNNGMYGKKISNKHKEAISKANSEKKTNKHSNNIAIGKGANTFCVYKEGVFIGKWSNYSQCARDLNLSGRSVSRHASKPTSQYKNYTFVADNNNS